MQQKHLNMLDTLRRVQVFLDTQATPLGAVVTPTLRTRLNDAATQLATFQVEQGTATGSAIAETANQDTYRKEFYSAFMRPIARIAKASLKTSTDFQVLTVASRGVRNGAFLGAAQGLADAAAKYESTFIAGGMAADFLTQLRAAIAQLAASKDSHDRNASRRSAATDGIKTTTKTANDVLVVLDSVISPALKLNPSLLADWNASKRVAVAVTALPPQPTGLPVAGATTAAGDSPTAVPPSTTTPAAPAPQAATPAV